MQAERFRLARLASVGRQEEKLNISIKAKLHIVDVDVVVVGFLLVFFPPWRTQRARLYVFVRGFAFQSLDEEAVGQRGNPTPCENIPFPAGGGDRQVCQKMLGGGGNGGLAAPTSCRFMLNIQQEVISLIGSLKLQVHVLILHSKDAFFLGQIKD